MFKKLPIVGVMGSGRKKQAELAEPLGRAIASLPVHLLTGGGKGVMRSVSKGFTSMSPREGMALGIIPMRETADGTYETMGKGYPNPFVEIPIHTPLGVYDYENPDKVTRNYVNVLSSNIIIALPGGVGTKQEVELSQKFKKAVIMYGPKADFADCGFSADHVTDLNDVISWIKNQIKTWQP